MNKKDVIAFFDGLAENWDAEMIKSQEKIKKILDIAEVTEGKTVLDIGCGTGVLIPDYLARSAEKCVAVDISPKMLEIAKNKFREYDNLEFLCADAEEFSFPEDFDCIVIYNAFPHFVNPTILFENLSECLEFDGRITVAHGMSRDDLIKHHSGRAQKVSSILPETEEMQNLMSPFFKVDIKISTDDIYIVSGIKKAN